MTCYQTIAKNANPNGDIVFYNHKIKIKNFLKEIDFFASGLVAVGLTRGDVVTIYLPTCPQSLVAFYACSKLGLIANFVHPVTPIDQLKQNLEKTQSKALLFYDLLVRDERKLKNLGQIFIRCSIADTVVWRKPFFALYSALRSRRIFDVYRYKQMLIGGQTPTESDDNATVCYMHSGGTSGESKIVKLSNYAVNGTADGVAKMYHPHPTIGCYSLVTLPIFHAYGLVAGIHAPLMLGYNLILVPKFEPKKVARDMSKYNVTLWSVVPAMIKKMQKEGYFDKKFLKNLDVIWCGGDFLEESLVEKVDQILANRGSRGKLMRGYGLTETCGVCVVNNYDNYQKGSCGLPMPNCRAVIVDDNYQPVPTGTRGEIVIYAPGATSGYLDGSCPKTEDGGVKTGDVGYLDEKGFLYVVDRKKRSVKIAAVNVFPSEVEKVINQLDFVADVCVVPYQRHHKTFLKAFVTLHKPMSQTEVSKKVIAHCKRKLMRYSIPTTVQVLEQMPLTKMAKIDYQTLTKMANEQQ